MTGVTLTADRRRRIARTTIQSGIAAALVVLAQVTDVLRTTDKPWVPLATAVVTVIVGAIHNIANSLTDNGDA